MLCALVILTPHSAFAAPLTQSEQELTRLVEQFTQAQVAFEPAVLKELTTEDYIEVSPLGEVDPRDKMLGFYDPEYKVEASVADVSEINVRIYSETAVVVAKVTFCSRFGPAFLMQANHICRSHTSLTEWSECLRSMRSARCRVG